MAKKKTPAKQLDRDIEVSLAARSAQPGRSMESITRERVHEPFIGERVTRSEDILITVLASLGPEPWKLVFARGRNIGGGAGGRILITLGGVQDPLAGLVWVMEGGKPHVTHVWVDSDVRGRGISQQLFDAYRSDVSPDLVVVGPFTKGGRAAAERAGATIVDS
jgi:hypothetical protein